LALARRTLAHLSPLEIAIMAWGIVLLCLVLGSLGALRPSGRQKDFRRPKQD
jgi:hypothetical protein